MRDVLTTGYGRTFREANTAEWGHADVHDVQDAGHWLRAQSWCDGRLGVWGGSYGGYLVLGALVDEPDLWRAGVDLFGDSEIAESYRHGDRVGRIDLERQMGKPDDPERAPLYRRGSPLYRAERIQAPLLILHGRKDKRVVPLMSEKMIEALEIEGKFHEVHWYDEEGHGWQRQDEGVGPGHAVDPIPRLAPVTTAVLALSPLMGSPCQGPSPHHRKGWR